MHDCKVLESICVFFLLPTGAASSNGNEPFPWALEIFINIPLRTEQGSDLSKLLADATPLKPAERANLLYESQALENAHQTAATTGDTTAPSANDKVDLHFVTFVKTEDNHLWEMDGRRRGPLDRGLLDEDEDVLSEKALGLGVRAFMKRENDAGGDLRFSLIVLAPSFD